MQERYRFLLCVNIRHPPPTHVDEKLHSGGSFAMGGMECRNAIALTVTLIFGLSCRMHSVHGVLPVSGGVASVISVPGFILFHWSSDPLGRCLIFSLLAASPQGQTLDEEESANQTETTTKSIEDGLKEIEALMAIGSHIETTVNTTGKLQEPYAVCEKSDRICMDCYICPSP